MKKILITLLFIMIASSLYALEELGKVVSILGDVDITSISTGKRFVPQIGTAIRNDFKIRTGKRSYMEILLLDGTKIFLREVTVLNVSNLKMKPAEPPTKLRMLTGKLRITLKKTMRGRSLILRTPTAVAGVRGTDFGAITGRDETKLVVFQGKVEVANSRQDMIKSYIVNAREEVSVRKDQVPTSPRVVPSDILEKWFDYYDIDESNRIIRRKDRGGILDRILRKKEF